MRITLSVKVEETKRLERLVVKNSLCAQFEKKETNREIVDIKIFFFEMMVDTVSC